MKDNANKFHFILSPSLNLQNQIQIENSLIKGILCGKLFGAKNDHKLAFDQSVKRICERKRKIISVS